MGRLEAPIQQYALARLELLERLGKVYFFRNNSFAGFIHRQNRSQGYVKNNKKGMPDIVFCYKGRFIGLELKSEKGKQSPDQIVAQDAIQKAGGIYAIIKKPEDLENLLAKL